MSERRTSISSNVLGTDMTGVPACNDLLVEVHGGVGCVAGVAVWWM